jgi:tetratricopeptide (TPR) repeat protein
MQTSELASALATLELTHGSDRKARSLFKRSLVSPTENSAAQASWSVRHAPGSISQSDQERLKHLDVPRLFEMRTQNSFFAGYLEEALQYALRWLEDQPFSVRPAHVASYLAAVLGDHKTAVEIERFSLVSNPNDWLLLNNVAFSLINLGELLEASEKLKQLESMKLDPKENVVVTATRGLLAYRSGDIAAGRTLYARSIEEAQRRKLREQLTIATIHFAWEELRTQSEGAKALRSLAHKFALNSDRPDVRALLSRMDADFVKHDFTLSASGSSSGQ